MNELQTRVEPVAWINRYEDGSHGYLRWDKDDFADLCIPLYTTPQTKPRLSDEEIGDCVDNIFGLMALQTKYVMDIDQIQQCGMELARAIEERILRK